MEYKKNRNLKIRAWDPLGSVFYLVGLILIVNYIEVGSGETNPGVIIGALLFIPGVYLSSLVTTDLSCNTCTGVILESKSIDQNSREISLACQRTKQSTFEQHFHLRRIIASTIVQIVERK